MNKRKTQEDTFQTSIRLPMSLYDEINRIANESERTVADQIRFMLKKYLEVTQNR